MHGLRVEEAAHAAEVSVRTAYKWLRRFREEGRRDRWIAPRGHVIARTLLRSPSWIRSLSSAAAGKPTARSLGQLHVATSTIARLLRHAGLHRLAELEPALPHNRYEYARPGQLLHLGIKKLARFRQTGHRVIDDRTVTSRGIRHHVAR